MTESTLLDRVLTMERHYGKELREAYPFGWELVRRAAGLPAVSGFPEDKRPAATNDIERLMDAEHRWCVQVEGDFALRHGVEAHRPQAEYILAVWSEPVREAV